MTQVRRCTIDDLDWLMNLAFSKFGAAIENHDNCRLWTEKAFTLPHFLFLRTDDAALAAYCTVPFFNISTATAVAEFAAGNIWHWPALLRAAGKWAKEKGAPKLIFKPTTGVNVSMLAKRMGFHVDYPTYVMELA